jgi:predicted RNA polymerase sigma factor
LADRVRQDHRRPGQDRARCGLAEELAQDALVFALERWPDDGVPAKLEEMGRRLEIRADGPADGLAVLDALDEAQARALADYPLLPAVRGDLLAKPGRRQEARLEFERAAASTKNERERAVFTGGAAACAGPDGAGAIRSAIRTAAR